MNNRRDGKSITFLIGSMRRGGAERVISILANHYAARGWNVDILTLLDNSNDYELDSSINFSSISDEGKSRFRQLPSWLLSIRRHVKQKKPTVIVSFIARINIITILACLGMKQRIIVSERNDPTADGRSMFVNLATYLLYPLTNRIVFQTKWAQSCFTKRIKRKSIIIPNPINVTIRASKNRKKKIVAVGRLIEQKNHSMLISAFNKVLEDYPGYSLYIYGEGRLRDSLKKQINELELKESVFLPGNLPNVHEKIADAEIFVLPSNYEGLSNALLEAMMMGLPCISTDCAGSNEVIENGESGLLIEIGNEAQLYQAMCIYIKDKDYANNLAEKGRTSVRNMNLTHVLATWRQAIEID